MATNGKHVYRVVIQYCQIDYVIGHTRLTHSYTYSQVMTYLNVVFVSAH